MSLQMFKDICNYVELQASMMSLNQCAPFGAGGCSNST